MVIDTALPTTVPPTTVSSQTPTVLPTPGSSTTVPNTDHALQPFGPQEGSIAQSTVIQASPVAASALPNSVAGGNQTKSIPGGFTLPSPTSGTGSIPANSGTGSGSGAGSPQATAGSGSGSPDVMPKKEEEYYDDSELSTNPPERSTLPTHGTTPTTTTSATGES